MASKDEEVAATLLSVQAMLIGLMTHLAVKGVLIPDDFEQIIEKAIEMTHGTDALISALAEEKLKSLLVGTPRSGEPKT